MANHKKKRETAGELSLKASKDTTKYNALEVGYAMAEDIGKQLEKCIKNHLDVIAEEEFCLVMIIAEDPLIKNLKRRKFYAWPYLPSPRPNQSVFLFNRSLNRITKRLWILPSAMVMAELSQLAVVDKRYHTMQAWSVAFYMGQFWEYIRHEHNITMPSEKEYFLANREELIKAGCKPIDSDFSKAFDFSKVLIKNVVDTDTSIAY